MNLMILEIILLSLIGKAAIGAAIDTNAEHTQKIADSSPVNHIDTDYWWPSSSDLFSPPKDYSPFVRFARNPNNGFVRFGRSGSSGNSGNSFVRFGRAEQFHVPRNDRTGRDDSFVRFGRSRSTGENKRLASQNFLRFGRYNDNNRIRFSGKRDGNGGVLRKLPEDIEFLLNDLAQPQPQQTTKTLDPVGEQTFHDNGALDELYRNQEQASGVANDAADDK